jgi:hypothetical protein
MSKLCAHCQNPAERNTEATETVRAGAFAWVKGIDPDHWHCTPAEMFPGKRVLARLYPQGGDGWEHQFMAQGEQGAQDYALLMAPRYDKLLQGGCYDVEGPNEPHPNVNNWRAYCDFEQRWVQIMALNGLRPWVWSFGVGWPGLAAAGDAVTVGMLAGPMMAAAIAGGGVALHEYGAPTMQSGGGWWTLRYRRMLAELQPNHVPIIISECGIDGGLAGNPRMGWKRYANVEQYRAQLAWYDDEICKDADVLAATVFTTCPTGEWATFNVNGEMLKWMAAHYNDDVIPEPPTPGPDLAAVRREIQKALDRVDNCYDELDAANVALTRALGMCR